MPAWPEVEPSGGSRHVRGASCDLSSPARVPKISSDTCVARRHDGRALTHHKSGLKAPRLWAGAQAESCPSSAKAITTPRARRESWEDVMKVTLRILVIAGLAIPAGLLSASPRAGEEHSILSADMVQWGAGPASLPPGAQAAVLYGDPAADGLFVMRLKLPAGYHIAPHNHPKPEVVTIISGSFKLGSGETADPDQAEVLEEGALFAMPPGMAHYVFTEEETVVQLSSVGPWSITYVNAADDPRTTN